MKERRKLLIVDGYNVLRSGSRYLALRDDPDYTDDYFNRAREMLLNDTINFAGHVYRPIIVYDGADNVFSKGEPQKLGAVTIIFSPSGSSADKVIEKLAFDARARGVETLVVTSDASIQDAVFGFGVDRMSANDFSREVGEAFRQADLAEKPKVAYKNTIASRLDPETLEKLKAIRDAH